jgi:hypothetical protein
MSGSNLLSIELEGGCSALAPGQTVAGEAAWQVDLAKSVEIRLFWYTAGRGIRDVQIIDSKSIAAPNSAGQTQFSFQLPEQPYSFSGKFISLIWAVELVIQPGDHSTRAEFIMAPGGKGIVLADAPQDA